MYNIARILFHLVVMVFVVGCERNAVFWGTVQNRIKSEYSGFPVLEASEETALRFFDQLSIVEKETGVQIQPFVMSFLRTLKEDQISEAIEFQKKYPISAPVYSIVGQMYMLRKNYPEAEDQYLKAIKIAPEHIPYLQELAKCYAAQKNYVLAIELAKRIIAKDHQNKDALLLWGCCDYYLADTEDAIIKMKKLIDWQSKWWAAYNNQGVFCASLGHWDEAIRNYKKAVSLTKMDISPMLNLALAYAAIGRDEEALQMLGSSTIFPEGMTQPDLLFNRGFTLAVIGHYDQARVTFLKTIESDPKNHLAYYMLGYVYYKLGDYGNSFLNVEKSIHIDAKQFYSYNLLFDLYTARGKKVEDKKVLKDIYFQDPNKASQYALLGGLDEREDNIKRALQYYKKALQTNSRNPIANYYYGCLALREKKFKEAEQHLQVVLEEYPNTGEVWYVLGICYELLNKTKEAERSYRIATIINPRYYLAHIKLSELLAKQNKIEDAKKQRQWAERIK